jgi:hypothetical protein
MCEGYIELAPFVENFCTNMPVVKKSKGLQSMLFYSLTLSLFNFVFCFEHVTS